MSHLQAMQRRHRAGYRSGSCPARAVQTRFPVTVDIAGKRVTFMLSPKGEALTADSPVWQHRQRRQSTRCTVAPQHHALIRKTFSTLLAPLAGMPLPQPVTTGLPPPVESILHRHCDVLRLRSVVMCCVLQRAVDAVVHARATLPSPPWRSRHSFNAQCGGCHTSPRISFSRPHSARRSLGSPLESG